MFSIIIVNLALNSAFPQKVFAHPGNTASDGCHYCRTNCSKWGEVAGARHCHGGYTAPAPTPTLTKPSCPLNASYSSSENTCVCNTGYTPSLDKSYCIIIPANAHEVNNNTNAWECDYGYEEINNSCVEVEQVTAQLETTPHVIQATYTVESAAYIPYSENYDDSESDGSLALGLLTLGGFYAGKKYLDNRNKRT